MAGLRKLIKRFLFDESVIDDSSIDSQARINAVDRVGQLKADLLTGYFPTGADIKITTPIWSPGAVKAWVSFEAISTHAKDATQSVVTSLSYRLTDGTSEYWWNGSAWVVNATSWNTQAEVCTNIPSFPLTLRKLGFVVNLSTSNRLYTPRLHELKVCWEAELDSFQEDIVSRSLIPALKANVRPSFRHVLPQQSTGSTLSIAGSNAPDGNFDIVSVEAVYNYTDDPNRLANLYSSFDYATQSIALSTSVAAGKQMWVRFHAQPDVHKGKSREVAVGVLATEVTRFPAIVIKDVRETNKKAVGIDDTVVDYAAGNGWRVPGPRQADLDIMIHGYAAKPTELDRLAGELQKYLANTPLITSTGLDEQYRLWLIEDFDMRPMAEDGDIHSFAARLRVSGVLFFEKDAVQEATVAQLTVKFARESAAIVVI